MTKSPPVFGVTGWKNSGKTTLTERIIAELTARGFAVASVKHAHHKFDIDTPGTDSFRHREAGARETAIVGGARWAIMHELRDEAEPSMDEVIARLSPCDIVIVEGYKREAHPKIECRRADARKGEPLTLADANIVGIASDTGGAADGTNPKNVPVFQIDDIASICDFVLAHCRLPARAGGAKVEA
ncbi:MAG: molybdopterin-guanine dinucleotide biosynthesis protein B [Rhodobiaceae bacterium]|nr:molybdopterin-guanine dinucleotide biosynthesis protein B [Rhodobiaceae bacterium]MCC0018365.1 molybdopterin-guanine dinucleotide biosynthesis protein B [Rhodobiaceae bacterium]MCC0051158.1 molybdopterin-guanine dinucleotide biosynthesis protein B [Rhodobiaceae bacterium]MCC0060223.1 molybdopterin-guanine dinucleotide biosynthesis protein B [Rhodobiaceae bacterium]